jgi:drug/metabolite transporter (DMT)-like permease
MTSLRHFSWFMALGLFWGISPSLYKHLADIGMPVTHTIFWTGLGVGVFMLALVWWREGLHTINRELIIYGGICAFLLNIPFGLNLYFAAYVPPTELAIIITLSPFFNYLLALATRTEAVTQRKLLAIIFGFVSTLVLILSREGTFTGNVSWWLIGSLSIPLLYMAYGYYTSRYAPPTASTLALGAAESLMSALWVLPVMLLWNFPGQSTQPSLVQHWVLLAVSFMWVLERLAYFTLIREKGIVYTVQATYVSTPIAVGISALIFGGGTDVWLWVSLAILMLALWYNNTSAALRRAEIS